MVKAFPTITRRQKHGTEKRLSKGLQMLNLTWE